MALEEWASANPRAPALERLLGTKELARLVGVSAASLHRYESGGRLIPDLVAARAHFLAMVVGELAGAYNDLGIRCWFERNRHLMDGKSLAEPLSKDWNPDELGPHAPESWRARYPDHRRRERLRYAGSSLSFLWERARQRQTASVCIEADSTAAKLLLEMPLAL